MISKLSALIIMATVFSQAHAGMACEIDYPISPEAVVAQYLKEDFTRGKDYWGRISKYTTWHDSPGWDSTILISGFKITKTMTRDKQSHVEVVYENAGRLINNESNFSFEIIGKAEKVLFNLVKRGSCWKIKWPQNPPHLNFRYIIEDISSAEEGKLTAEQLVELRKVKTFYDNK